MIHKQKPRDERWSSYPETVLVFSGEPEVFVDLREKVPPATRDALGAIGLGEPFGILSAFNPRGVDYDAEENARRMEELEAELRSAGYDFARVDACSPDRTHCECSVALKTNMKQAVDIAKRWEQVAIFWWDGSTFWIQGAITDGHVKLPVE